MVRNIFILLIVLSLFFFISSQAFAAPVTPKIQQPIPGGSPQNTLSEYVFAVYRFAVLIIGIIALGMIIYAGFVYISGAGNPSAQTFAKEQIYAALTGLFLLLVSFLLLNIISPQFTTNLGL